MSSSFNKAPAKKTYKKRITTSKASQRGASRGQVYGAAAGQLYKDVQLLKSMINVEYKVVDTSLALASVTQTPIVTVYNPLVLGTDYFQRTGRSVKFTSMYHRLTFQANQTATTPQFVRYILFWYKDPSGVAPTPLQMFGSATPGINGMMNLNVRKDFEIIEDEIIPISPVSGGNPQAVLNKYFKLNKHTIYGNGNTGTIADIESYALCSFCWSSGTVGAEQPYILNQSRMRFIDN
jgi:hypothetical protein